MKAKHTVVPLNAVRRTGLVVLAAGSAASFASALVFLAQLRSSTPPVSAHLPSQAAWLNYYWWYSGLPAEALYAAVLGAALGSFAIVLRSATARAARWAVVLLCLGLANLLYAIIPGGLFYRLEFYPPLASAFLTGFTDLVSRLPGQNNALDLIGLLLLLAASILVYSLRKEEGRLRASLQSLEVFALGLLPLPLWVYFTDRRAFDVHVADIQAGTPLAGVTNADLLLGLSIVLPLLLAAELGFRRVTPARRARNAILRHRFRPGS